MSGGYLSLNLRCFWSSCLSQFIAERGLIALIVICLESEVGLKIREGTEPSGEESLLGSQGRAICGSWTLIQRTNKMTKWSNLLEYKSCHPRLWLCIVFLFLWQTGNTYYVSRIILNFRGLAINSIGGNAWAQGCLIQWSPKRSFPVLLVYLRTSWMILTGRECISGKPQMPLGSVLSLSHRQKMWAEFLPNTGCFI